MRLIVVDSNAPWVRSLFLAMPSSVEVRLLSIGQPQVFKRLSDLPWLKARRWHSCGTNALHRWVVIPGWTRAPALSTWMVNRAVNETAKGADSKVIFTLPQYAGVAERTPVRPRVYYAHDPFEFYDWNKGKTRGLEQRMLNNTENTFAISKLLRDDLAKRTDRPVHYSPNAVSSDFLQKLQNASGQMPADISAIPRPIVGCVGNINPTYDWAMISQLVDVMPDVSFVFIGPVIDGNPEERRQMDSVLTGRKNVHWLKGKPHADLPAYLSSFDICLNPLAPGPHADRRSPLRLYDYLATGKPVVSTPVAEAAAHDDQIWIGGNATEIAHIIRQSRGGDRRVDFARRANYIQQNTWQQRALQLLEKLR